MGASETEECGSERWECGECGWVGYAPIDKLAGQRVTKIVGEGRREREIETAVCPKCQSGNWHSKSVDEAFLNRSLDTGGEIDD